MTHINSALNGKIEFLSVVQKHEICLLNETVPYGMQASILLRRTRLSFIYTPKFVIRTAPQS